MSEGQTPGENPWDVVSPPEPEAAPSPYPAAAAPFSGDPVTPYGAPGAYPPPAGQYPQPGAYPPGAYPPPGYGQAGYIPVGAVGPGYPAATANGMSIAALICGICGFLCVPSILGVIFGFIGLSQIKRTGQRGRGMAIAGIVCGLVWLALIIIASATGHTTYSIGSNPDNPDN